MKRLQILKPLYFDDYQKKQLIIILKQFNKLKRNEINYSYVLESSAAYSSMIEGNNMDLESYLKIHHSGMDKKNKAYIEIQDLAAAYVFAKTNKITVPNILKAHKIASKNFINDKSYVGKIRDKNVFIFANGTKIYTGAKPEIVKPEIKKLVDDIVILINRDLTINEVFYYASYIHLVFSQIQPFAAGNGRLSRLLEKWFLVQKLGSFAWNIQSEKMYQENLKQYYTNINMGTEYENLNYNLMNPFLLMLPVALRTK